MHRINRLTSIRGLAALYVAVFHCQEGLVPQFDLRPWTNVISKGYLAVDFFFVLSGFILAYVYAESFDDRTASYPRFLANRFARIYPVHLAILAITATIMLRFWGFEDGPFLTNTPRTLVLNGLAVHSWGFDHKLSWNFPSWSISVEWFAYLAFPAFIAATSWCRGRPWVALTAAASSLAMLGVCAAMLAAPGIALGPWHFSTPIGAKIGFSDLTADFGLVRISLEFLAGVLLCRAYQVWRDRGHSWTIPLSVAGLVLLALLLHSTLIPIPVQDPIAVGIIGALILCVALGNGWAGRPLDHPVALFLGEASYSIYMVHGIVLLVYYRSLETQTVPVAASLGFATLIMLALMAVVLVLGIAVYRFVEVPSRTWVRAQAEQMIARRDARRRAAMPA